jgi:hypothetical protein
VKILLLLTLMAVIIGLAALKPTLAETEPAE